MITDNDCTPNDGIYHDADKYFTFKMKDKKIYTEYESYFCFVH